MNDRSENGFALLIVAITLAALSLVFAAALSTARQHLNASATELRRAKMLAAADAAIATAEYELASAGATPPAILSGPEAITIGDYTVVVAARPETSKLDLNAGDTATLRRYFVLAGLDEGQAQSLVAQIVTRRKRATVSVSRTRYENHASALFQTASEIGDLRGGSRDLADCVEPDVTVFSGTSFVDAANASERLRSALGLPAQAEPIGALPAAVATGHAVVSGEIFEIVARAGSPSGEYASRQVIVRITGNIRNPIWTLARLAPAPSAQMAQTACDRLKVREASVANR